MNSCGEGLVIICNYLSPPYQAAFPIWTPAWPMCMEITSLILDIFHSNECPLKVQGRSCMSWWRLLDVFVLELLELVAVRLSPGGLCLDDGIHHRESPVRLWLVAKTPYVMC